MLKEHKFYVYHEGPCVYARMDKLDRVLVKECGATEDAVGNPISAAQAAHDYVQSIVNPTSIAHTKFGAVKKDGRAQGYLHPDFQSKISDNCKDVVLGAYAAAKKTA